MLQKGRNSASSSFFMARTQMTCPCLWSILASLWSTHFVPPFLKDNFMSISSSLVVVMIGYPIQSAGGSERLCAESTRRSCRQAIQRSFKVSGTVLAGDCFWGSRGTHSPPQVNVPRLGGMMKHWGLRIQFYRIIGARVRQRDRPDLISDEPRNSR